MSEGDLLNLQCLVGNYLNGFKIVSIEKDPFIKGQINLFTDSTEDIGFGDRNVIKFYVRDEKSNATICRKQINKGIYILTEFEKWLEEEVKQYQPYISENMIFKPNLEYEIVKSIYDKLQELEEIRNDKKRNLS